MPEELSGQRFEAAGLGKIPEADLSTRLTGPRQARLVRERQRRLQKKHRRPIGIVLALVSSLAIPVAMNRLSAGSTAPCAAGKTALVVASSLDKAPVLSRMAAEFSADEVDAKGRCVEITVSAVDSGTAKRALAKGWTAADGPFPDVYSPTSSVWLPMLEAELLSKQRSSLIKIPLGTPSITTSPEVIAMPRPMAMALGWPNRLIGWKDIFDLATSPQGWAKYGHPEWGKFSLGKTNPNYSQEGLDATVATYYAATAVPGVVKTKGLTLPDVQNPNTRAFVSGVEQSIMRYGDSSIPFLVDWQRADQDRNAMAYLSALVTQEHLVVSYNEGNPTADPAASAGARPRVPLAAVYPKEGTAYADHPYAVLSAPWVTQAKRDAADSFLKYLVSDRIQGQWQEHNYRTFDRRPSKKANLSLGVQPIQPSTVLEQPEPAVVNAILASWEQLRKTGNILSLIDVSGSMAGILPGAKQSKLAAAQQAAITSLGLYAERDEVGFWAFSSGTGSGPAYRELVPIGPMNGSVGAVSRRVAITESVKKLQPKGPTSLYDSIAAAYRTVAARDAANRISAIVILTDGKNETTDGIKLEALLSLISSQPGKPAVRIITIAYGPDADRVTLSKISQATKGAAYVAPTPEDLAKVYASALSNF